jgi:hypothetical protein
MMMKRVVTNHFADYKQMYSEEQYLDFIKPAQVSPKVPMPNCQLSGNDTRSLSRLRKDFLKKLPEIISYPTSMS